MSNVATFGRAVKGASLAIPFGGGAYVKYLYDTDEGSRRAMQIYAAFGECPYISCSVGFALPFLVLSACVDCVSSPLYQSV